MGLDVPITFNGTLANANGKSYLALRLHLASFLLVAFHSTPPLISVSMNWPRKKSGKNEHYLRIIKVKSGIKQPERIGAFVWSKARFPAFHYPALRDSRTSQCPFELGPGLVRYTGGGEEERGRSCCGTSVSQCGMKKHLDLAQVQEETACFLLVTLICSDKQFLWSPAQRDITGNDRVFTGGWCVCTYAQTCTVVSVSFGAFRRNWPKIASAAVIFVQASNIIF